MTADISIENNSIIYSECWNNCSSKTNKSILQGQRQVKDIFHLKNFSLTAMDRKKENF